MAITPIPNQPVNFNNIALPAECACMGQEFSQLINKNDQTQFQIKSTSTISNGGFGINLDGWNVFAGIEVLGVTTNETGPGECDGAITASATGGTGPYIYSIDGGAFGSGIFTNLCSGDYLVTAKDANGNEGSIIVSVGENVVCGDYADSYLSEIDIIELSQIGNCELNDFN